MLFTVPLLAWTANAASFTASLDRDTMTLGEQATLSLTFEGGQASEVPQPGVPGLQFNLAGNAQNYELINGKMSSRITTTFIITPQRAGDFIIPALKASVNGQQLTSQPLKLSVGKASAPSAAAVNAGTEVAFMKINFPAGKVYVGQSIVGQLELYLRDDVQNFGDFQLTQTRTEGFSAGKLTEGQRRRVQVGNRVYTVVPVLMPLTVIKPGALELGPFTGSAVVVLPSRNDRGGDPFAQFFNSGEQRRVTFATDKLAVEALPLPTEGRPADFTGAVGDFTMSATAGPATVTVGDPVTVRVQIAGRGALDTLTLPSLEAWRDFKTYPPTAKLEPADQFGFSGAKTFEQIVSPLTTDVHELPPLTFSFFNPADGRYHTLTQPAMPLTVHPAGATPLPVVAADKNAAAPAAPTPGLLPHRENLGRIVPPAAPLITQPVFLAAQSLPVLAFLAALVWRRRTDNLANNPRLRRRRAVAQLMASGLKELQQSAAVNQPDAFFATLFRLLQEQLGERLDCPASAVTEEALGDPALASAPAATRQSLQELFQLCNQARYAPVRGSAELNSVAAQFEKAIRELQEVKA